MHFFYNLHLLFIKFNNLFKLINIKNISIILWLVKEKNLILTGFFTPVSSRRKYLAKKYWSKKETNAREVTYAWKHASKVNTYKGFYIPSTKPKTDLANFFFQKWEEDEKKLKEKQWFFWNKNSKKKLNFLSSNKWKLRKNKITKFYKISFFLKNFFLKNFVTFNSKGTLKGSLSNTSMPLINLLKLSKDYAIFLKKKKIYTFKYKNFLTKKSSIFNFNSKLDFEWFILNRGYDSSQFFNFFFFVKLPNYLAFINFNYLKILFLKNLKFMFKHKFQILKKKYDLFFLSNFSMFLTEKYSKYLSSTTLDKQFFFLNILKNWTNKFVKINFFCNAFIFFFLEKKKSFLKSFFINILKKILDRLFFFNDNLLNKLSLNKKKFLLNFLSKLVGLQTFTLRVNKKWKKLIYSIKFISNIMPIYNTKLLANNNLLRYFFKKNLFFLNNISNFDFFWFLSKIYKFFTNFFWMNYIFSSSRSLIFFTHFNSLFQKWILFYSNENDKLEKFSNVYLKSIQTYKSINMLMSQSLSQQLDVYVNINLINMLFKFLIKRGKKLSAWKVFIKFIRQFKNKYKMPALAIFTHAVLKLEPKIWLKKKKIAGWIYEIPIFISSRRSKAIAIRWLLEYAKKRQKYNFADSLSQEIWDACFNRGSSFNAKVVVHSTAKRNKSYMRWF